MSQNPAEKMHNRILNGTWFTTDDVTADAFEAVARNAGTLGLSTIKRALERLRSAEKLKQKT